MKGTVRVSKFIQLLCIMLGTVIYNHNVLAQNSNGSKDNYLGELDKKIPSWLEEFVVPGAAIA